MVQAGSMPETVSSPVLVPNSASALNHSSGPSSTSTSALSKSQLASVCDFYDKLGTVGLKFAKRKGITAKDLTVIVAKEVNGDGYLEQG